MSTLRTIAATAGVHVATASVVLNSSGGNTRVSADTRLRVLAAARKHSYVRNELARRLRTGQSNVVGFLGGDLRNPFFAELAAALEDALARHHLQLLVSHVTQAEPAITERTIGNMRQENVKRIICWEESAPKLLRNKKLNSDILSIGFTRRERPGVWLDLEYAIQAAVQEMTARGYKKLGFYFPQSQTESPSVIARSETFVDVCRKRFMADPSLASYAGESWDLLASIRGARIALENNPTVEAWIGFNDISGLGLLRCLPWKWSARVVCFDGTILSRCWPGKPAHLDLKISDFAQTVASVISAQRDAQILGRRDNWFKAAFAE